MADAPAATKTSLFATEAGRKPTDAASTRARAIGEQQRWLLPCATGIAHSGAVHLAHHHVRTAQVKILAKDVEIGTSGNLF